VKQYKALSPVEVFILGPFSMGVTASQHLPLDKSSLVPISEVMVMELEIVYKTCPSVDKLES